MFPLTRKCLPISTSVCYANTVTEIVLFVSLSSLSSIRRENQYDSCSLFTWNRDRINSNARWLSIARFWTTLKMIYHERSASCQKYKTHEFFTALLLRWFFSLYFSSLFLLSSEHHFLKIIYHENWNETTNTKSNWTAPMRQNDVMMMLSFLWSLCTRCMSRNHTLGTMYSVYRTKRKLNEML